MAERSPWLLLPLALLLNVTVTAQGSLQFWGLGSCAGVRLDLPLLWFQRLVALVLLLAAWKLLGFGA